MSGTAPPMGIRQRTLFGGVGDESRFNEYGGNRIVPQYCKVGELDTPVHAARCRSQMLLDQCGKKRVFRTGHTGGEALRTGCFGVGF